MVTSPRMNNKLLGEGPRAACGRPLEVRLLDPEGAGLMSCPTFPTHSEQAKSFLVAWRLQNRYAGDKKYRKKIKHFG
jgi:hypothetical protein